MICSTICIIAQPGPTPLRRSQLTGWKILDLVEPWAVYCVQYLFGNVEVEVDLICNVTWLLIELYNTGNCCIVGFAHNCEYSLFQICIYTELMLTLHSIISFLNFENNWRYLVWNSLKTYETLRNATFKWANCDCQMNTAIISIIWWFSAAWFLYAWHIYLSRLSRDFSGMFFCPLNCSVLSFTVFMQ